MKIHTQAIHFSADQKLIDFVEKKISKLNQLSDRIIDSKVLLKLENKSQIKDKIVEVTIHLPGATLYAKEVDKTFENAIDKTIDPLKKQLIKYKARSHS